jgi:diaminopimelate decarboxylase
VAIQNLKQRVKQSIKGTLRPFMQRYPEPSEPLDPGRWGLEPSRNGLKLGGVDLQGLLSQWGSPLHVVDASRLRANAERFLAVPHGAHSGCEVYYSYKSNPIPGVLSYLHDLGVGAEVISEYELWLAQRLDVPNDRIVYNGPAKSDASLRQAIESDILLLNFNHREEVARVARAARELGKRVRVGVRVSTSSGWSAQFGIPIEGGAALAAYAEARECDAFEIVGLHAHRGGMIHARGELSDFLGSVLSFTDTLYEELGLELSLLDVGGSLGTTTVHHISNADRRLSQAFYRELSVPTADEHLGISDYVATVVSSVERHYASRGRARPRVLLEPGRAMTGDAQFLLSTVVETKRSDGKTYAILDAGINLAESARNEYHQLLPVNRFGEPRTETYTVVGPICTPGDTLYPAVRLPELRVGDSVAIMDAGAYFVPFSTSFSFPRPAVVMIEEGSPRLLRRAERFEDLIEYDELSPPRRRLQRVGG